MVGLGKMILKKIKNVIERYHMHAKLKRLRKGIDQYPIYRERYYRKNRERYEYFISSLQEEIISQIEKNFNINGTEKETLLIYLKKKYFGNWYDLGGKCENDGCLGCKCRRKNLFLPDRCQKKPILYLNHLIQVHFLWRHPELIRKYLFRRDSMP